MTDIQKRPVLRLKPKKAPQRFRFGAPWVFSDEVVLDRRTKALKPGTIVEVQDENRVAFAVAAFNPESKIVGRILDLDVSAKIDADWLKVKIIHAFTMRERLYDTPFYRLIHAEADGLPGVIVDRFGDVLVLQPNAAWAEEMLDTLVAVLIEVTGAKSVYKNASGRARSLDGLDDASEFVVGSADVPISVPMNGATYLADFVEGQKTGLFFDQRDNHAFAAGLAKDGRVLDVFSHVGGFGLAALAAGAASAICVDASQAALDLAVGGAKGSGVADRFAAQKGDAFNVMRQLHDDGEVFDLVVCDPPAFAPNKAAAEAGRRGYERAAIASAKLVAPGGYLVLCSCSHAVDLAAFREISIRGIGRAGRVGQLIHTGSAGPDHPEHLQLAETSYLKALFFRLR